MKHVSRRRILPQRAPPVSLRPLSRFADTYRPVNKRAFLDLDNPDAVLTKFLRYYREVYGRGTLEPALIDVA